MAMPNGRSEMIDAGTKLKLGLRFRDEEKHGSHTQVNRD